MRTALTMSRSRILLWVCCGVLSAAAGHAQALTESVAPTDDQPPAAPVFSTERLVPLEMPPYVSVKVGIDPETISVSPNGIVRYVVVMRNGAGSVTAAFEGIFCATGQVKTYARAQGSGPWITITTPVWRDMADNLPSRHAHAFARQGACDVGIVRSPNDIVRLLRQGRGNN